MKWQKVLGLVLLADLAVFSLLMFVFFRPIKYRRFAADGIVSIVPAWKEKYFEQGEWKGRELKGSSGFLRIIWREAIPAGEAVQILARPYMGSRIVERIPLFEGGWYFIEKASRGFYIVVFFAEGRRVFWITLRSSISTMRYKHIMDIFLTNLSIDGKRPSEELARKLREMDRKIPWTVIQTEKSLIIFLLVALLAVPLIILVVFTFMGRCPSLPPSQALLCSPMSSLEIKRTLQWNVMSCCACLFSDRLVIYRFGKKAEEIPLDRIEIDSSKKALRFDEKNLYVKDFERWKSYLSS